MADQSAIRATRIWPSNSGVLPPHIPEREAWAAVYPDIVYRKPPMPNPGGMATQPIRFTADPGTPTLAPRQGDGPHSVLSGNARFVITTSAQPPLAPESFPSTGGFDPTDAIGKWSPVLSGPIYKRTVHASRIPSFVPNYLEPIFDPAKLPYPQNLNPVRRIPNRAYLEAPTTKIPMRLEIHPAMWHPHYPPMVYSVARGITPENVPFVYYEDIPPVSGWMGSKPDFIWRRPPISHLAPSWFGTDTARPNQPDEVEDYFVWFQQYPEFVRRKDRQPHLYPFIEWDITYEVHGYDPPIFPALGKHYFVMMSRHRRHRR